MGDGIHGTQTCHWRLSLLKNGLWWTGLTVVPKPHCYIFGDGFCRHVALWYPSPWWQLAEYFIHIFHNDCMTFWHLVKYMNLQCLMSQFRFTITVRMIAIGNLYPTHKSCVFNVYVPSGYKPHVKIVTWQLCMKQHQIHKDFLPVPDSARILSTGHAKYPTFTQSWECI